jgi:formate hydrogenlyase subunit 6/NADH:ubiquinone oxidoreductase subunit I
MKEVFVGKENLRKLIGKWSESQRVFVPVGFEDANHPETPDYELVSDEVPEGLELHGAAPAHTPKSVVFYPREVVANYPSSDPEAAVEAKPTIIVGPRGCDLRGLAKFDKVYWSTVHFTEEYDDPFYTEKRKNLTIVSVDCTAAKETCFCTVMGGKPYPEDGFDLNISPVDGGFVIAVGSEKGEALLSGVEGLVRDVDASYTEQRDLNRRSVTEAVERQNAQYAVDVPYDKHNLDVPREVWADPTQNCVGCSACNRCCPTCTCFLLVDQRAKGGFERIRHWDSCLSTGFARVGGGANARGALADRFANRIRCKLEYSRDRYGLVTCTGCGRCIDVCMGRIDMREAIKHVVTEMAKA